MFCKKLIICLFIFFASHVVLAIDLAITVAGHYSLGNNLVFTPSGADSAISIQASNVTLDLADWQVSQSNATATVNAIDVAAGLNNVTIRNGTIRGFSQYGINVGDGCDNIQIEDITLVSCAVRAINLTGTALSQIQNSGIFRCNILNCCAGATGDYALVLTQCLKMRVSNITIESCGAASHTFSGLRLNTCSNCDVDTIKILRNIGSSLKGIELIAPTKCTFTDCIVRNNDAVVAANTFLGIDITGSSNTNNIFTNCQVVENSSLDSFKAFNIESNTVANLFVNCLVSTNTAPNTSTGYYIHGSAAPTSTNNCIFIECISTRNRVTAAAQDMNGWLVEDVGSCAAIRCIASYNVSLNNRSAGFRMNSSIGGTNEQWEIKECQFFRNVGSSDGNSFGTNIQVGTNNLWTRNIAFNNGGGTATAQQFNGLPAGAVSSSASSGVNSTTLGPWTNLGVPT